MKNLVIDVLEKALKKKKITFAREELERALEVPPKKEMGDFAFPCFILARELKMAPHQIALELRAAIGTEHPTDFDDVQTNGPYLNFFFDRKNLARKVVWETITKKKTYGQSNVGKKRKIVVEFSSPNVAKPFGIGHLRSTIIGNALANIASFLGYKPVRLNYLGDWGTQFGRILLGYEKYGSDEKLLADPLVHLMYVYVKVGGKKYDDAAKELFKKLENGDKKALMLWKLFRDRSLEEFQKLYKEMNISFDEILGESQVAKKTSEVFTALQKKGIAFKNKGAWIADLTKDTLGKVVLVKDDGATTYALRDLAGAIERYNKYKFSMMIYEVGQEQSLYFRQLFKLLELLGYDWAKNCVHVEHGLYCDKNKKKFATRKGKTIFMKDILGETVKCAKDEIKKRQGRLPAGELERRANKIALAAIFYGDLKTNRKNNVVFDPKKFVSFEGDTGSYLLYSYARASSIITKSKQPKKFAINDLSEKEYALVQQILQFEEVVKKSFESMLPSLIAQYCFALAKAFNEFYHACPVIGSENEAFRLALVEAFRIVLRRALGLLGIETISEM